MVNLAEYLFIKVCRWTRWSLNELKGSHCLLTKQKLLTLRRRAIQRGCTGSDRKLMYLDGLLVYWINSLVRGDVRHNALLYDSVSAPSDEANIR